MEITAIGYIVIPISVYLFIKNRFTHLLYFFVFITPFSAASILQKEGSLFGLQPSFFVAILLIALTFIKYIRKSIVLTKMQFHFLLGIITFWLISLISLNYPALHMLLDTQIELINPILTTVAVATEQQDYMKSQFIYLTFFLLTPIVIMIHVDSYEMLKKIIKIFILATLCTCLWGLLVRYPTFFLKIDYPDWIFNNHAGYAQGWNQNFVFIPRLCSVAPEPSMYGYFLTFSFALLLVINSYKVYLFNKVNQNLLLALVLLTAIITTSSTSYVGIVVVLSIFTLLSLKSLFFLNINKQLLILFKMFLLIAILLAVLIKLTLVYVGISNEDIIRILNNITINKLQGGSGSDRFEDFRTGINILLDSYLIGTGSGTNRTVDLISTLLANIGLVGMISFLVMIGLPLMNAYRIYQRVRSINYELAVVSLALCVSFTSAIVLNFVSISDFIFMYFWLIFGLLLSLPKIVNNLPKECDV